MSRRLLSMYLVLSLLLQSSGLLFAQEKDNGTQGEQANNQLFLPLVSSSSAAADATVEDGIIVDFAPGTSEEYKRQVYADLGSKDAHAAYTRGPHWGVKFVFNGQLIDQTTARGVGGQNVGESLILTWSIIPDGTNMPASRAGDATCASNLIATYNAKFGPNVWREELAKVFDQWSAISGLVFERELGPNGTGIDDGAAWPSTKGAVGLRGDIRIGGCQIDGTGGIFAYNFLPNTGDMKIDTTEVNLNSGQLATTAHIVFAHEIGHGLGLYHTCPDPISSTAQPYSWLMHRFDTLFNIGQNGPQHDDIRGIQRMYGDNNEVPQDRSDGLPQDRNDNAAHATALTALSVSTPVSMSNLSMDSINDQDWFSFTAITNQQLDLSIIPIGQTYPVAEETVNNTCPDTSTMINSLTLQNLGFEVRDSNGTTILTTGNSNAAGIAETLSNFTLGAAGTKYIRIFGGGTDDVQLYNLQVTLKGNASVPTNTPAPATATATNTPLPPTATATNTAIPPTATATATSTSTPQSPTATSTHTATPLPPTATPTSSPTSSVPRACYWIENKLTSYVLDVNGANQNQGERAIVWSKNVPTSANQLWYLNSDGTIESKLNGLVLDIFGSNSAAGTNVITWPRNVPISNNQLWNQVSQANGYITIQSRLQGYLLDLQNGSSAKGTSAVTSPQGNPIRDSQLWKLTQAPAATCAADLSVPWSRPSQSPAANSNGWNNTDVTVTWNWSDYGSSGLNSATCPATSSSNGQQGTITLRATCRDNAGNTGSASYTVKIDKTLPVISSSASSGGVLASFATTSSSAGAAMSSSTAADTTPQWYNKNVLIDFICADGGAEPSGVAINSVTDAVVTSEGANQSVTSTGECVDQAGNRAQPATVAQINIDKTAPVVDCSVNLSGSLSPDETLQDITVTMNVNDSLSGSDGFSLVDVNSNQPESCVVGDDIQGWERRTADLSGQLRAETGEDDSGRIYMLTYLGKDLAGNMAICNTNVTVAPPSPEVKAAKFQTFVALGEEGVILREGVKVVSGDIAANRASEGPWLGDGAEVSIGENVTFADSRSKILADTLHIGQGTQANDVGYNELTGPGTILGSKHSPQPMPLFDPFITMPTVNVGTETIEVPAAGKYTLVPGSYGAMHVAEGGEVTLSGGLYSFSEWKAGDHSRIVFAGPSEVRIAGQALVGMHSYVGPALNSALSPKGIVIFVSGVNADNNVLGGLGPKAATFGPYATLGANVVALNGTLLIRERSLAVGSFVGRWVSVGKFSQLFLANRFDTRPEAVPFTLDNELLNNQSSGQNATVPLTATVNQELETREGKK